MGQRQNKIAFFSVVYPGSEPYLSDFLCSLNRQTYQKFDLIVCNDGLENLQRILDPFGNLKVLILSETGTPATIRSSGIRHILAGGYDSIVFGDSDDFFDPQRIEKSMDLLSDRRILFNDLHLAAADGGRMEDYYLSNRFENKQLLSGHDLAESNCIGLTNASVRAPLLRTIRIPSDVEAVDWYLFARLLAEGYEACFTNETWTCYRQHPGNFIGLKNPEKQQILRMLKVKVNHYRHMKEFAPSYGVLEERYRQLAERIESEPEFKKEYISFIQNRRVNSPLWWESVCLMENRYESTFVRSC